MIKVIVKENLQGAEKYGECISCGSTEDIVKIEFMNDSSSQRNSIRLCHNCADILIKKLKW